MKRMIKVNSYNEIKGLGDVVWEEHNINYNHTDYYNNGTNIRISGYGVFHLKDDNYPKYFKWTEAWDSHSCDDYWEQDKELYIKYLNYKIEEAEDVLNKYKMMLEEEV